MKILQILGNTINTRKHNTLYYAVFYLVLFFGDCVLLFMFHWCVRVCSPILTNVPNLFNFQRINFCPKLYMDKSLSLIKLAIIMCDSVLGMKDCNGEVLRLGILEVLRFSF